jgi:hypothetical protein
MFAVGVTFLYGSPRYALFHRYWDNGSSSGWVNLGDMTSISGISKITSGPSAAAPMVGNIDVVLTALGTDGKTHLIRGHCGASDQQSSYCNSNQFSWFDASYPSGITIVGTPDVTSVDPGDVWNYSTNYNYTAIVMAQSNGLWEYYFRGTTGVWSNLLSGVPAGVSLRTSPTIASLGENRYIVGVTSTTGVAWSATYNWSWSPWAGGLFYNIVGAADYGAY